MSVLRFSEAGPKIACTPVPTTTTPDAPRALSRAESTWAGSFTDKRRRVMHASRPVMLPSPPNASTRSRERASSPSAAGIAGAAARSSVSLPGVFKSKRLIANRNTP